MRTEDLVVGIARQAVEDTRLTAKARGMLVWMVGRRTNAEFSVAKMVKAGLGGPDAIRTGLQELEDHGYLTREREYDADGHHMATTYIVTDIPNGIRL